MCSTAILLPSFIFNAASILKHVLCQTPALSPGAPGLGRKLGFLKQPFSMAANDSALCFSQGQTGGRKLKRTGIRWEIWKTKTLRENLKTAERKIKQEREAGK